MEKNFETSEKIGNLISALFAAGPDLPVLKMDGKNPFTDSEYATLGNVIDNVLPVLRSNGIGVSQFPISDENGNTGLTTLVSHIESGEWIRSTIFVPSTSEAKKSLAQVAGSVITYLRRYALVTISGVYGEKDIDGNVGRKSQTTTRRATTQTRTAKPTPKKEPAAGPTQGPDQTPIGSDLPGAVIINGESIVGPMTLDTALNVYNSKGVKYADIDSEKLSGYSIGIGKSLNKARQEKDQKKIDEYLFKMDAVSIILAAREKGIAPPVGMPK